MLLLLRWSIIDVHISVLVMGKKCLFEMMIHPFGRRGVKFVGGKISFVRIMPFSPAILSSSPNLAPTPPPLISPCSFPFLALERVPVNRRTQESLSVLSGSQLPTANSNERLKQLILTNNKHTRHRLSSKQTRHSARDNSACKHATAPQSYFSTVMKGT
jgi:hypothetical protein